ncbi:DNAJA2 [Cordylochernes scorpioides]|uniref:DNAJA2 n=1 Tax=Cordylochernes scorpioides TaxID=51811 RepID=A0ABY6KSI3_9ARAC|nr:DNAJA2 [Cordylochernes scorpioides]
MYNGKTSKLQLKKNVVCRVCEGQGGKAGSMQPCRVCGGRGLKIQYRQIGPGMVQHMQSVCTDCNGEGEIVNERDRCKVCKGKKVVSESKLLEVHVDKGMHEGEKIFFRGEGDQTPGGEAADVIIILQQKPHELFHREGNDLFMKHTVSITEALCGFNLVIKHLDDREIVINHPAGNVIEPGCIKGVVGEGMPTYRNPFEKGNLYIKFDVQFPPNHFTTEDKLLELEKLLPEKPAFEMPVGDNVEEVDLHDNDMSTGGHHGGAHRFEAYDSDDDNHYHRGPPGVQCAHQ